MLTLLPDTDPILRQVAEPVVVFDDALAKLVREMYDTMLAHDGVGLAAPQVGISKRIIVAGIAGLRGGALINPEITELDGEITFREGCLSFPQLFLDVKRARKATVKFQDIEGVHREMTVSGTFAVIVQHEVDHLDGKLFVDKVSSMALALAKKKLNQQR